MSFASLRGGAGPLPVVAEARKPLIIVLPFTNPGGLAEESLSQRGDHGRRHRRPVALRPPRRAWARRHPTFIATVRRTCPSLVTELGVDYAVRGSVRRAGNTVRLSAQLVDARSGLTLWADRYERVIDNLFAAQDEISETIVSTLAGQLEDEAATAASRKRTENMEAYDFLLRGIYLARALDPTSAAAAIAMFEKALALDPDYPLALAWFALMKLRLLTWGVRLLTTKTQCSNRHDGPWLSTLRKAGAISCMARS